MNNKENIERFESLLRATGRRNIDVLLDRLQQTDLYSAPSSTRFHLSVPGGLLQHSLNVYDAMKDLLKDNTDGTFSAMVAGQPVETVTEDSISISALLHDVCKVNVYQTSKRWRKDDQNRWEQYDTYEFDDPEPFGHGEKSVWLLSRIIRLKPAEAYAIRFHMGAAAEKEERTFWNAVSKHPFVFSLHAADVFASQLMEENGENAARFRPAPAPDSDDAEQEVIL